MCQGLNDPDTTQMGENSLDEVPEGVEDPDTATSPGTEGMVNTTEVFGENKVDVGLGQQQEQLDQSNPAARNGVVVENTSLNPSQVEGHASDSESNDYAWGAIASIPMSVSACADSTEIMITDFANCAMEDLVTMSQKGFNPFDIQPSDRRLFTARKSIQRFTGPQHLHLEASRETAYVSMNRQGIVELLMDLNQWAARFSDLVSRAIVLAVVHSGASGSYDGALQVMTAEFHIPTPLVPPRECYFARYCKQLSSNTWGVVDISLDFLFPCPVSTGYRRRPSGCLIQELANGYSKVTWIELVEVDNRLVHKMFQPAVCSGFAFGAQRWVGAIARESHLLQALMNRTPSNSVLPMTPEGRRSLLKVVEKMIRGFFADSSACSTNVWMPSPLHGNGEVKIMVKDALHGSGLPGRRTVVLSTSAEIPVPPKRVFNFLSDDRSRPKWDILSENRVIQESVKIIIGADPGSRVSVHEIKHTLESRDTSMFYLQKSYIDSTFSYVVYAPINAPTLWTIVSGGDSDPVKFMASGFTIFPDCPVLLGEESSGSLLTVMFHILDDVPREDHSFLSLKSLDIMQSLISGTVKLIKDHTARGHRPDSNPRGNQARGSFGTKWSQRAEGKAAESE